MRARTAILTVMTTLGVAACGGSSHSTSAPTSTSTSGSASVTLATQTTQAATSSTTVTRPPEVPRNQAKRSQHASRPLAPATNVRIPASFTIRAGGAVSPALISVPKGTAILLQIRDLDSHSHTVAVGAPGKPTLQAQPERTTSHLVTGLADGSYRILVDGRSGARIVVGSAPGP